MIPRTRLFEYIEDYCLGNLEGSEKIEFENQMKNDNELKKKVKFEKEIQAAIVEEDIIKLKNKLSDVAKKDEGKRWNGSFDLFEDFTDIQQLTSNVPPEELLDYYDSLPKAHVYQHELISNENIHPFYREQNISQPDDEVVDDEMEVIDDEALEEAVLEKDIINLRNTLSRVSRTIRIPFSTEKIDNYLQGELTGEELNEFEKELKINNSLQHEVKIHSELERALSELDISKLRGEISHLLVTETSWNVKEQDIEEFIDGQLQGDFLEEFSSELRENTDLKAEVALRRSVDEAIGENDIISLREQLLQVQNNIENKKIKSIIPSNSNVRKITNWWKAGVAVAVLLFAFAGLVRNEFGSTGQLYDKYYRSPEWSPQRSVAAEANYLQKANICYNNGHFLEAIALYDKSIEESSREKYVSHFFKGASFQNLEKYKEAIPEFTQVIKHGDNLFVEEAEWYKSLCYIKTGADKEARRQLFAIIERKGYYEKDAKAILRGLRYSFK